MVNKTVLGLQLPSDPRWVNMAEMNLEEILTDHAFCEQKAATTIISIIQQYPTYKKLVRELSPIVTEEWGHFRLVIKELDKRNLDLGEQRRDEYVRNIMTYQRGGGSMEDRLLEKLLTSALIEARSCERFRLLSVNLQEPELQTFYYNFMVSEAGHYKLFLDLAKHYFDESRVEKRWNEYLEFEAEMIKTLEVRGDRMH